MENAKATSDNNTRAHLKALLSAALLSVLAALAHAEPATESEALASLKAEAVAAQPVRDHNKGLSVVVSGISHHFKDPKGEGREFNERNAGIGLQYDHPLTEKLGVRPFVGTLRDSFNGNGWYAGTFLTYELLANERWSFKPMAGLYTAHRAKNFDRDMYQLTTIAPAFSLEHKPSGLGVNIMVAPPQVKLNKSFVGFVFVQGTMRF